MGVLLEMNHLCILNNFVMKGCLCWCYVLLVLFVCFCLFVVRFLRRYIIMCFSATKQRNPKLCLGQEYQPSYYRITGTFS